MVTHRPFEVLDIKKVIKSSTKWHNCLDYTIMMIFWIEKCAKKKGSHSSQDKWLIHVGIMGRRRERLNCNSTAFNQWLEKLLPQVWRIN
jgi:hypothetical protein